MPSPKPSVNTTKPSDSGLGVFSPVIDFTKSNPSMVLMILVLGIALIWLNMDSFAGKKKKVAKGKWAEAGEKKARRQTGLAQIKEPKRSSFSLYINSPESMIESPQKIEMLKKLPKKYHSKKKRESAQIIPNSQTSMMVAGMAGCGKSYGVIDRLIQSAIEQGLPLFVYDFKYPTQAVYAVIARLYGYKVYFFAPGEEETHFINLLDFIKSSTDSIGADNLAKVISMNCGGAKAGDTSDFFDKAGQVLVQATFLLSKWVAEFTGLDHMGDILTASLIAALPNLAERIQAINSNNSIISRVNFAVSEEGQRFFTKTPTLEGAQVGSWVTKAFEQIVGAHGNGDGGEENKTETSIVSTALATFETFVRKDLVPAFCSDGSPTEANRKLPVDIGEKTMYVFGVNRSSRYSVAPLIATLIQSMVDRRIGVSKQQKNGLVVGLDELPTLYIPGAVDWPATARSAGICLLSGIQNIAQLASRYGDNDSKSMIGSHGVKILFNPGELESAETYSKMLGDADMVVDQPKSRSHSAGGSTTSYNKSLQQVAMRSAADFLKFKQGEFVLLSSASANKEQAYIPELMQVKIDEQLLLEEKFCNDKWPQWIETIKKSRPQLSDETINGMIEDRKTLLENLFPESI
jgi:type IV secretory pathway TraG/TraD family ATPase VirD4